MLKWKLPFSSLDVHSRILYRVLILVAFLYLGLCLRPLSHTWWSAFDVTLYACKGEVQLQTLPESFAMCGRASPEQLVIFSLLFLILVLVQPT